MNIFKFLILILFTANFVFAQNKKIAYCSNEGTNGFLQIFVMNQDGSEKKQLTSLDENCMKPKWSPDGKQITFYSDKGFVYLIRDVSKPDLNYTFLVWNGYNPVFLPYGDEIMFNSEFEDVLSVFIIDTASTGAEPELVTDGSYSNMQTLSNDGNFMIYSAFVGGVKTILLMDLQDTTDNYIKEISKNDESNLEPDISADNKKYVYASFDNNLRGTIRINKNGNEASLTKGMGSTNVPRFSPDGKNIAFVLIGDKSVSLYVMDENGNGKNNLNVKGGNVGTFQWMDNENIIYDAGSESNTNIGIVNIKTGENKVIASGGFNLHPCVQK